MCIRERTDAEIAQRVGLSVDQARFIRIYLERQNYRIDQHRRLYDLGGWRRWRPEKYNDPAQRMGYPEPGLRVKKALAFDPTEVSRFFAEGLWNEEILDTWMARAVSSNPDAPMLITDEETISYAEVEVKVVAVAEGLKVHGVGRGDIVAMQLPNTIEFVIGHLAVARIGAVLQTIHMPYLSLIHI